MKLGMPAHKIALGMGTYGRAFKLTDSSNNGLNAPTRNNPAKGPYTREAGFLAYYEICKMPLTVVEENAAGAPYGYHKNMWVGYDTQESLANDKVGLIKEKGMYILLLY
jgi:chitinase